MEDIPIVTTRLSPAEPGFRRNKRGVDAYRTAYVSEGFPLLNKVQYVSD